ncbi:ABC transporter substrate-binding protein [Scytonema sp. UIC 10036]|uniref:nSTAND1 domain-containing NTPase n=1 Tax=Scytonema sp. UIC 10036 TaxID=2304196 RepID=UPI0012DA4A08|nr:ABC transporter substrate-binding protein [Scytonema sp. UIC 10036]MUG98244.1 ABC transporter substrate-binding protein [Scytonema sp. UIC 10036]
MDTIKNSYAVIIGINEYKVPHWKLKTAVNDTCELTKILKDRYEYEVLQLLDEQATRKTLDNLLTAFENQTIPFSDGNKSVEPDDRILFYFAGHGVTIKGNEKDDGPQGFIYPQDAMNGDNNSLLPMRRLHDALVKLGCRHLLIILDCCFAGSFRWVVRQAQLPQEEMYLERYNRYIAGYAQEVITSSAYNETAADILYGFGERGDGDRHSPFAQTLFEAINPKNENNADINNDGIITITEIIQYIENKFLDLQAGQTPGYSQLKKHDFGKYIFVTPGLNATNTLKKAPLPDEKDPRYPYKGLLSFEKEDKEKFFGRKKLIKKLLQKIKEETLSVVLGTSGSGKSSLVKAGILPELEVSTQPEFLILDPIRPGEAPLTALARVCNDIENPVLKANKTQLERKKLNENAARLAEIVGNWSQVNLEKKLLLVIDQLEEVVTLCRNETERKLFLKQLNKAMIEYGEQLRIVVTLRSDYEPVLRSLFQSVIQENAQIDLSKARFEVTPMTREELREVIVEPAEKIALFFEGQTQESESSLVDRLIDEAIDMPGGLSLLSFTLSELYRKFYKNVQENEEYNRVIKHKDYEDLGKVTGSLTKRADEIYCRLVNQNKDYAQIIKYVTIRMVTEGSGDLARRKVFMTELEYPQPFKEKVYEVIDVFTQARLLVKGQDEKKSEYVEPAHDALVRGWDRLREWIKQETEETLILQRRLTPVAEEWKSKQPDKFYWNTHPRNWLKYLQQRYEQANFLWYNNPYLDVLKEILHSPNNWYNVVEAEFVQRSVQRRKNNRRIRTGLIATAFAVVSGFAFIQWCQSRNADTGRLAATSDASFNSNKQLEALNESLKAGKLLQVPIGIENDTKLQAMTALHQAVYWVRERKRLLGHKNTIRNLAFSPNGQIVASTSVDTTIKLWNLKGETLNTLAGYNNIVNSVSFSPNGQMLVSGSYDRSIKLWSITGKLLDDRTQAHTAEVYSVSFSPDGKILASSSWDGTIKLWSISDGKLKFLNTLELSQQILKAIKEDKDNNKATGSPKPYSFHGLSFSPDGKIIAAGNEDRQVWIWSREGKLLKTLPEHSSLVYGVSFSPDGKMLASFSADRTIVLWNVPEGKKLKTLTGHKSNVFSAIFSTDGKTLISASDDTTIKFWRVDDGRELKTLAGHSSAVRSVSISPDGKILASAGIDTVIKLWGINSEDIRNLSEYTKKLFSISFSPDSKTVVTAGNDLVLWRNLDGKKLRQFLGNKSELITTSFSPDGQILASGDTDGNILLCNLVNNKKCTLQEAHQTKVKSLSFSPDRKILASASEDKTIKLWDREGNLLVNLPQTNKVLSISFSPDGNILASGSTKIIQLWDVKQRQLIKTLVASAPVNSLSFSSDGKILASGNEAKTVQLWSIPDGKFLDTLKGHGEGVNSVNFLPNSDILASGSSDRTIRLWHASSGTKITVLKGHTAPIYGVSFSPDGKTLASASPDGTALFWDTELFDLNTALARGCQLVEIYRKDDLGKNNQHICNSVSEAIAKVKISSGDKNLVPTRPHPDKVAGIDAFIDGKFTDAAQFLQRYLNQNPNDPEALIYKNNAEIGQQKSYAIAVSVPLGSNVNGALEILRGVAQAQNEINLAGGINGVKLQVLIADDENNPKVAREIAKQLVKNSQILGVVGNFASDVEQVTSRVYEDNKLVVIFPVSTSVNLTKSRFGFGNYLFRTVPSDREAVTALAKYMEKHQLNTKKVAIFYNSQSDYSRSFKSEFERTIKSEQIASVFDFASNDFHAANSINELLKAGAEVLVLLPNTEKLNIAMEVLKNNAEKQRLPVLGGDSLYSPVTLEIGANNAKDMVLAVPWNRETSEKSGSKFTSQAQQLWRGSVSWRTAMSYDATQVLIAALFKTSTRERVAEVLQEHNFYANGASGRIGFINGESTHKSQLVKVVERQWRSRSNYEYIAIPNDS